MRVNDHGTEKVIIAGAGPAGSSLAIRLARAGSEVLLIERSRFPRHKLCGEFISPECLNHFRDLGVIKSIESAGGDAIRRTVFYAMNGISADVPSEWFPGSGAAATGLSRAEMDLRLLEEAKRSGAEVIESASICGAEIESGRVAAVEVRFEDGRRETFEGDVFVDATGRQRILSRCVSRNDQKVTKERSPLIGFKAHFSGVRMETGRCEIYFFPGGYGGLSFVEGGIANHCFLISSEKARELGGDADTILGSFVLQNKKAGESLSGSVRETGWLAVAVEGFGVRELCPAPNMFAVGDAGAFIDPFTGSGILMALESSELLARALTDGIPDKAALFYTSAHKKLFRGRLRSCNALRLLSSDPRFASLAISAAGLSSRVRKFLAETTRKGVSGDLLSP